MTGYAGGVHRKVALLKLERVARTDERIVDEPRDAQQLDLLTAIA